MDISIFLARVLGIYLVVMSIAILTHRDFFMTLVKNIMQKTELLFILGLNILIIGVLLIVSHNHWEANWAILITIVSWLIFLKGIFYLWFPKQLIELSMPIVDKPGYYMVSAVVNFLLGIYFCYFGFFATSLSSG